MQTTRDRPTASVVMTLSLGTAPLGLTGHSSNQSVVRDVDISVLGNSFIILPAPGAVGAATITLTVTDARGATAQDTFVITVNRK